MSDEDTLEKALKATNNGGLQQALDWLDKHANDADIDNPIDSSAAAADAVDGAAGDAAPASAEQPADDSQARSLVCNECGKQFNNEDQAQYHAVKSGHSDFAQSTEEVKPLTEEEKAQKVQELQDRIKQKRKDREAAEKAEQRQNELLRRKAGQDASEQQERMRDEQMKRDIENRKREKDQDKLAERKIKEQIEQDKRDRAARFAREKAERDGTTAPHEPKPVVVNTAQLQSVSSNSTQARLQIRPIVSEGDSPIQPITHVFDADQPLKDVFDFVKKEIPNVGHHFKLSTTFPRQEFSSHHVSKTLRELGLVPSAALILTK
ncbi:hypothetical protein EV177_003032 [Coemansia sp. RSA 1804]|nr:hypothetical protein EV177_003032 [Coemansia sp. RSA 1804]